MREIKFRVWDGTEMWDCEDFRFNSVWEHSINWSAWKSLPDRDQICNQSDGEIMQYTGLKDKNGKEIYEGDIVFNDADKNKYYEIIWDNENAGFSLGDGGMWLQTYQLPVFWEVIGNTYENPELLTKE
jgi:uncharacterized phage protein (TIGR01671 family)